jgi:hypothetical protein
MAVTDEKFGHFGEWGNSPQVGAKAPVLRSGNRTPKPPKEIVPTYFRNPLWGFRNLAGVFLTRSG